MNIVISTVDHAAQRYDTVGDWIMQGDQWTILISKLPDSRYEFLVALHEYIEMALCHFRGISQKSVDRFDIAWLEEENIGEPGDDRRAPYYTEHQIATGIERILAAQLGVDWNEYDAAICAL